MANLEDISGELRNCITLTFIVPAYLSNFLNQHHIVYFERFPTQARECDPYYC